MEIRFTDPDYLRLLIVIPVIIAFHFFSVNYKRRRALNFANFDAIERITGTELISKNIVLLVLNILIATVLIFSASGLTLWYEEPVSSFNYVIGIDSSKSMEADDFYPNRLEFAKATSVEFIRRLPSTTNVGVISFSGIGYIEQQPSSELHKVINAIEGIQLKIVGGTDISEAVVTGTNMLSVLDDPRPSAIILMTDGQFNVGPELKEVIDYAKRNDVTIFSIGLGTPEGGQLREGGFSKLDENTLKSLAFNTNGAYFIANTSEAIQEAFIEIIQPRILEVPHPIGGFLAIFAILLLVVHWWLSNMRYGGLP